ncbi:MAG: sigma-54 dependent transcriptional regulator [Salibacteraceae bacterium]
MAKLLVIDDDTDICLLLKRYLEKNQHQVETAFTLRSGMQKLRKQEPDLVLCDYRLPDGDGSAAIERVQQVNSAIEMVIMTGYSDVKVAIDCIKRGAFEYVTKPIHPEEILHTINEGLERRKFRTVTKPTPVPKNKKREQTKGASKDQGRRSSHFVEGESPQSKQVSKLIDLVAPTNISVIISGETGTGKEYVAKRIHEKSDRAMHPFIAIDCGALPKEIAASELFGHKKGSFTGALNDKKGAFEMANGGTLFLDEVANLTYENQVNLLRVLQERKIRRIGEEKLRKVDVRILAASNEDLWNKAQEGGFREDLFHRLNEFRIQLSPLRERISEIKQFTNVFIAQANKNLNKSIKGVDKSAIEVLNQHRWDGNLRELKNVVRRAVLIADTSQIRVQDLPSELSLESSKPEHQASMINLSSSFISLKEAAQAAERAIIVRTLERTAYNKSKTAEILQVDRKTLYNKISAYDIQLKA